MTSNILYCTLFHVTRLTSVESEKLRYQLRSTTLKDQLTKHEETIKSLQADVAKRNTQLSQFDQLKTNLHRKEAMYKALKETNDKAKESSLESQTQFENKLHDADKKIK